MASPQPVSSSKTSDRDLASMAEARTLARRAKQAQMEIAELSQERIDAIVDAMAAAVAPQCESLAKLAVEETGFGVVADKVQKNQFSADRVYRFIRPMRTVGVLQRLEDRKIVEIAEPFGVVAAIVPTTNPTSTAIYKILICAEGAMRDRHQPASVGRSLHHARRRDHERGGARRRRARRQHQLDDDRHARRHAGADEEPRRRRDSGDRRHGARARGVQFGQAGVRRRPRQRAVLCRGIGRHQEGGVRTSSSARRSTTACSARRRTRSSSTPPSRKN